jgi:hypothetical protein
MPRSTKNILIAIILSAGVALIVAGESLYWYTNAIIDSLELKLSQVGLSQNNYYALQGSLNWWRTQEASSYEPISFFLIIAGISTVLILAAYCALNIFQNRRDFQINQFL